LSELSTTTVQVLTTQLKVLHSVIIPHLLLEHSPSADQDSSVLVASDHVVAEAVEDAAIVVMAPTRDLHMAHDLDLLTANTQKVGAEKVRHTVPMVTMALVDLAITDEVDIVEVGDIMDVEDLLHSRAQLGSI
jgi:hypothetical protein